MLDERKFVQGTLWCVLCSDMPLSSSISASRSSDNASGFLLLSLVNASIRIGQCSMSQKIISPRLGDCSEHAGASKRPASTMSLFPVQRPAGLMAADLVCRIWQPIDRICRLVIGGPRRLVLPRAVRVPRDFPCTWGGRM